MPTTATTTYTNTQVRPLINPEEAYESMVSVNLPASIHYAAGSVLGELTASRGTASIRPANGGTAVAVPGAVTVADGAGSTAYAAGAYLVALTWTTAAGGETTIGATASVTLTATHQINVTAVPTFPTGVTGAKVYVSAGPGDTELQYVQAIASNANFSITALPSGGNPPTTNTAITTSTGAEVAKYILPWEVATDAASPPNITYGATAGSAPFGFTQLSVPVFTQGSFNPADLVQSGAGQIDATGLAQFTGRIVYGDLTGGRIDIG